MIKKLSFTIIVLTIFFARIGLAVDYSCPEFPYFEPKTGAQSLLNCNFHKIYEERIEDILKTLGETRPIILNLGGTLVLKVRGEKEIVDITSKNYHVLKSYAHTMFSVYLALFPEVSDKLSPLARKNMEQLKADLNIALQELPKEGLTTDEEKVVRIVADKTLKFIEDVLTKNICNHQLLEKYMAEIRPITMQLVYKAAFIEIEKLDKAVDTWLKKLTPEEQKLVSIVVAVSHQARAEEISIQYFSKKFGFKLGEGAHNERNFAVLEGKFDEDSALRLLARHLLDREAASRILKDPEGLQHDLLSSPARKILKNIK